MHRLVFLFLLSPLTLSQKAVQRIPQPSSSSTPTTDFTCPEDFGYFPHPSDCTQYYVCVFGGALLESCTGGLMYSHELQTCDWPRNVYCYNGTTASFPDNNIENTNQDQRTRARGALSTRGGSNGGSSQGANPSSYSYNPIKIETYGQLRNAAEESVIGKKQRGRVQVDDEYQQQRSGRSYEGSLPNYKEEIYQGSTTIPPDISDKKLCSPPSANTSTTTTTTTTRPQRHRRSLADFHHRRFNIFKKRRPPPHPSTKLPRRRRGRARTLPPENSISHRMDMDLQTNPQTLQKYKLPTHTGFKSKPLLSSSSHHLSHRISSPGTVLYPPSFFNTPTYGFVNVDKMRQSQQSPRLRPNPTTTQPPRVVKITTSKPGDNLHDSSYYSSQLRLGGGGIPPGGTVLGEYFNPSQFNHHPQLVKHSFSSPPSHPLQHQHHHPLPQGPIRPHHHHSPPPPRWSLLSNLPGHPGYYVNIDKPPTGSVHDDVTSHDKQLSEFVTNAYVNRLKGTLDNANLVSELPKKPPTQVPFVHNLGGHAPQPPHHEVGHLPGSVSSTPTRSKYTGTNKYYDNAAQVQQQPQQEDYSQQDDEYVNQRYAAGVGNNTGAYYYPGSTQEDDDASYYVYDDEEDDDSQKYTQGQQQQVSRPQTSQDFDYKYTPQQPYTPRVPTQQVIPQTRRPLAPVPPSPPTTTSTRTRTRTRTNSGSSSSSSSGSTRSRPTLKPKSSIVKAQSAPVRDVYLDPPSRPLNVYETPAVNTPATKCKKDLCVLPDCYCGGKDIPGGLRVEETPQIVLLTFDDSVNDLNKNLYRDLFEKGRKNPNGCPISATFYISHEWTDYSQVQNLAADGHEIASHSVSHSFGEQYSQKKWDREINGQREILAAYGGVKMSEIRGMRAPFLAIGGNNMFKMLHDSNFTYDSSMPIYENRPPSWPYTLDYRIFHDCMIPPCPTKSYPGVWEVPMVMWQDLKGGRCSMGDACSNPPTAEGVYQMLAKNFERHYTTNRAPFGLYYHAAWFTQPHHKEGFEAFLDTLVQMDDVWLVTNWQALQWIRSPTPINRLHNFQPWSCHNTNDRPPRCNHPKVCNLWHKSGVRYMKTCQQCPQQYPWTGNTGVPYSNSL